MAGSFPRLMLYLTRYKERKRGAYIMKYARRQLMMDISEDDRVETEEKRRKLRIMRKHEVYFAYLTIN
jgi:hypothetical protein